MEGKAIPRSDAAEPCALGQAPPVKARRLVQATRTTGSARKAAMPKSTPTLEPSATAPQPQLGGTWDGEGVSAGPS